MFPRPKDYIVADNVFFAVVSDIQEGGRVLTLLRYVNSDNGLQKLNSEEAHQHIASLYPGFLFHSHMLDIELHGIPLDKIDHHLCPEQTVEKLLNKKELDDKQNDAVHIIKLLLDAEIDKACLGVTGSLMLETHTDDSDIDIVVYSRESFFRVRDFIKQSIASGDLNNLDEDTWHETWQRRNCELDFDEYYKHEIRKFNKCMSGKSKVDISMIPTKDEVISEHPPYKKIKHATITAEVIDDKYAYDLPARYKVEDDTINEVVTYTATYTGQARKGEIIEAAGYIEEDINGQQRLLVGTSREAKGEYIKCIKSV